MRPPCSAFCATTRHTPPLWRTDCPCGRTVRASGLTCSPARGSVLTCASATRCAQSAGMRQRSLTTWLSWRWTACAGAHTTRTSTTATLCRRRSCSSTARWRPRSLSSRRAPRCIRSASRWHRRSSHSRWTWPSQSMWCARQRGGIPRVASQALAPSILPIVQSLPQAPHLAINLVVQFGGATAALLLDRDDGPYALPDLATLPASVGASTSYSQAVTYLSAGVLEMWRGVDGALDFFRRYRRHHWALQWLRGSFTPGVLRPPNPFVIPPGLDDSICAFEKLISRGVLRQADACRLLVYEAVVCNECCDVGPGRANYPAYQIRILRSVLALPGLHLVDLGPRSEEPTTLGNVMYYDTFPLGFTYLLVSAGFTLWWKDSESSLQVCPLMMAADQGNWRQLALGLDVLSSTQDETVSWPEVMDALSDAIVTSSCLACTIDPNAKRCKRCRRDCAHSDGCDFEKCIDVLVYYGLRLWNAYEGDGASAENRRALAWRINERHRCRIAETRGANAPSLTIRRAFASPGGLSRYIAEELSSGTMTQSVHDVMTSAVRSGVHTQPELLSSEWRQKIFAAFDREITVPFARGQCDSDRHGNPPSLDAMRSATKQTSVCQRCRSSWYCTSIQCQKAHWPAHKHVCNKPHAGIDAVLKEGHAARCDCALSSIGVGLPPGLGATPCGSARCPSRVG